MELLVEIEVLLRDKLVMGREWGDESAENLQTEPGLFLQIREESCWERISEVREVGQRPSRKVSPAQGTHRGGLRVGCFQSK